MGSLAESVVSVGRRGCGADRLPFTGRQQKKYAQGAPGRGQGDGDPVGSVFARTAPRLSAGFCRPDIQPASQQGSQAARRASEPSQSSGLRTKHSPGGRSSSHHAHSPPGCDLRKDLKVRSLLFSPPPSSLHPLLVSLHIRCLLHGCDTSRLT